MADNTNYTLTVDADEFRQLAVDQFFGDIITKTLCNVKLKDTKFPGVVEFKLTQGYSDEQIKELSTIFFIGYNIAKIEYGK